MRYTREEARLKAVQHKQTNNIKIWKTSIENFRTCELRNVVPSGNKTL